MLDLLLETVVGAIAGAIFLGLLVFINRGIQKLIPYTKRKILRHRQQKNRQLIERGYGFLLSKEERDEVLSEDDVETLRPLQKPKIIKKKD
ncbi:MAG: hypothetical protein CMH27_03670 [Micavibrio sp.]|nr:hypothetical protein [Micavibrio sp.]|tara:strand:- start:2846 stop:3118 length:273 start_codon:yes stop_codon:yes gene_type:complete